MATDTRTLYAAHGVLLCDHLMSPESCSVCNQPETAMSEPLKPEYVNQAYELITGEPPASKLIAGNRLEMAQIAAVAQRLQSDAESHASELERVRRETVALIEEEAEEFGNLAGGEYYATRLFKLANSVRALLNTPETNP